MLQVIDAKQIVKFHRIYPDLEKSGSIVHVKGSYHQQQESSGMKSGVRKRYSDTAETQQLLSN